MLARKLIAAGVRASEEQLGDTSFDLKQLLEKQGREEWVALG
jgi:hypothetical protein